MNDISEKNNENDEIAKKLAYISLITGDAYYFLKMREYLQTWNRNANDGDVTAIEFMKVFNIFHRFCKMIEKG